MRFTGGLPETLCGAGSTIAETRYLRARLPMIFEECAIRSLLDAPCGDFNWMAHVDLRGIDYIGCDANAENLAAARLRADRDFRQIDIVTDELPQADAMLCRDFHQHLPNAMVAVALQNFVEAGISWLLATTHDNAVNEDIEAVGMFRRLNLMAAPFNLPEPSIIVADPPGSGHFLGVWERSAVIGC